MPFQTENSAKYTNRNYISRRSLFGFLIFSCSWRFWDLFMASSLALLLVSPFISFFIASACGFVLFFLLLFLMWYLQRKWTSCYEENKHDKKQSKAICLHTNEMLAYQQRFKIWASHQISMLLLLLFIMLRLHLKEWRGKKKAALSSCTCFFSVRMVIARWGRGVCVLH